MNRRTFLAVSAAASASTFFASHGRAQTPSPNSKLCHACIGVGGMGAGDLNSFMSHPRIQIVALCDVDKNALAGAAKKVPGARTYTDWRELLAKEGDKVDSVNVTVPDHMHASITLSALRARKHVYCQKPLCHDVAECRALAQAVKGSGLVTQLGTQTAALVGDRMAVHYLSHGAIGEVRRIVLFCTSRARSRLAGPRPAESSPAPDSLNWDLWLGTAPARGYAPGIYHPFMWRAWQDFGTGLMGDNGCHFFDSSWKGVGLTAPLSAKAEVQESWKNTPARRADNWPQCQHVTLTFPGTRASGGKEITVDWYDGAMPPPPDLQKYAKDAGLSSFPEQGSLVIGTEGVMLMPHGTAPRLLSDGRLDKYPKPKLPPHTNHYHHYLDACLGGEKTESDFTRTDPMNEAIMLGTIAARFPDTLLQWDAPNMRITNVEEANRLVSRTYRKGWNIPGLG
ncbi:MAG TPA: Gfo/Idh/MocA family oxidoreductase [Kiritimatiellia bacterium]|nr:Gfo/Idh/MocA family oxidoreductase [Kiritimatiellia bacterium]